MPSCPTRAELKSFVIGTLDEDFIETVGDHLATCRLCAEIVRGFERCPDPLASALRDSISSTSVPHLTAEEQRAVSAAAGLLERQLRFPCPHCSSPIAFDLEDRSDSVTCPECETMLDDADQCLADAVHTQPKTLGRYELIEQVGTGAVGAVWKAYDPKLDRDVAIKIPRQVLPESRLQLLREARAMAQMRHPNIVSVCEVAYENDVLYVVRDYVDGFTLSEFAADGVKPRQAAEVCATLAAALDYAHAAGVVHRDLKPSNILIDHHNQPLIVDFGLAKRDEGEITITVEGQVLGTPEYMSPEQARGEAHHVDGRSDIYSLGVILYTLLTGKKPFQGTSATILSAVVEGQFLRPRRVKPTVPRDLEAICTKCMQRDPTKRYATGQDVADDLNRYLAGEPVEARALTPLTEGVRWVKRNAMLSSFCTVLILQLVGLFVYDFSQSKETPTVDAKRLTEGVAKQYNYEELFHNVAAARRMETLNATDLGRQFDQLDGHDLACAVRVLGYQRFAAGLANSKPETWRHALKAIDDVERGVLFDIIPTAELHRSFPHVGAVPFANGLRRSQLRTFKRVLQELSHADRGLVLNELYTTDVLASTLSQLGPASVGLALNHAKEATLERCVSKSFSDYENGKVFEHLTDDRLMNACRLIGTPRFGRALSYSDAMTRDRAKRLVSDQQWQNIAAAMSDK